MVIEAKMLGCKLELNENVQHKDEIWFDTTDPFDTEAYLYTSREKFWNGIKYDMEYKATISGYTTVKDCISQNYPWEQTIKSMLGFCDEVVVVDGGSKDGTWERLQELAEQNDKVVAHQQIRDWNHPRFAIFDGAQKALARSLCTMEFCWQMDSDEILHEDDYDKIKSLCENMQPNMDLVALPIVEYWGGKDKVRADTNPWKWRLSRNKPYITHNVPAQFRRFDEDGELYSAQGSDGCDYVRSDNYEIIPCGTFYTHDVDNIRRQFNVNEEARLAYEGWYNQIINVYPTVYHFSWWDMERKVKTYRDFWGSFWKSLYNEGKEDTAENNMMFDYKWSDVTDEMIVDRSNLIKEKLGGWIWHSKWDGKQETKHVNINKDLPAVIKEWIK